MVAGRERGLQVVKPFAFLRQLCQQRRRLPVVLAKLFGVFAVGRDDLVQADLVGPEHGAALVGWKTVAVNPDNVDIQGAGGDAFLEDKRPFVNHGVEAALENLLIGHLPLFDTRIFRALGDKRGDLRVGDGSAPVFVSVDAGLGFLAVAAR